MNAQFSRVSFMRDALVLFFCESCVVADIVTGLECHCTSFHTAWNISRIKQSVKYLQSNM